MLYLNIYTENTYFNLDQVLHSGMHWIGNPVKSELVLEERGDPTYRVQARGSHRPNWSHSVEASGEKITPSRKHSISDR